VNWRAVLRATRPGQWTKNLLVFAAPAAAGGVADGAAPAVAATFVAFCLAAAATYLVNDVRDAEADRRHPRKCTRPIAAGLVTPRQALAVAAAAAAGAAVAAWWAGWVVFGVVAGYVALTTLYSAGLKRVAVVELFAVAAGFVLRTVAGAVAGGVELSEWFVLVASAGALLVVAGKREAELRRAGADAGTRAVLADYTPSFLASARTLSAGVMLVAYCLWAFSPDPAAVGVWAQLSVLPFAAAVLRYMQLADAGRAERPERLLLTDRLVVGAGAVWAAVYLAGVVAG
jgi:decaprenyl-phosphate phosphoribosyltransferase